MEAGGLAGWASPLLHSQPRSAFLPTSGSPAERTRASPKTTSALAAQERPQGRVTPAAAVPSQPPTEAESSDERCHSWD